MTDGGGHKTFAETPATNRILPGVMPKGVAQIPKGALAGVTLPVSQLIIGCDNRREVVIRCDAIEPKKAKETLITCTQRGQSL